MQFTTRQIQNWQDYEEVRKAGLFNMFDPNARLMTELTNEEWVFVMKNYLALRDASNV